MVVDFVAIWEIALILIVLELFIYLLAQTVNLDAFGMKNLLALDALATPTVVIAIIVTVVVTMKAFKMQLTRGIMAG